MDKNNDEKFNKFLLLKGVIIGATMLVPGVSGGSMAMILGIYDRLISAVSSFRQNKSRSFRLLLVVGAGGVLGMFLFSKPLLVLINKYPLPMMYFFMGAVCGSIPMIIKKSEMKKLSVRGVIYVILGIVMVFAISKIPADIVSDTTGTGLKTMLFLLVAGFLAAAALVLPGISISYILLVLGLYDEIMMAISQVYMAYLMPLGLGLLIGVILITKLLEKAMNSFPQPTYLIIMGFILGSMIEIFPGVPMGLEIILCGLSFITGTVIILLILKKC